MSCHGDGENRESAQGSSESLPFTAEQLAWLERVFGSRDPLHPGAGAGAGGTSAAGSLGQTPDPLRMTTAASQPGKLVVG